MGKQMKLFDSSHIIITAKKTGLSKEQLINLKALSESTEDNKLLAINMLLGFVNNKISDAAIICYTNQLFFDKKQGNNWFYSIGEINGRISKYREYWHGHYNFSCEIRDKYGTIKHLKGITQENENYIKKYFFTILINRYNLKSR